MDDVMPQTNDFLQQVLDLMNKRMDGLEHKIDDNTATTNRILSEAQHTNGRVTDAERRLGELEEARGKKFELSPNVIYLIALSAVILLVIVASLLKVDLGGLVK